MDNWICNPQLMPLKSYSFTKDGWFWIYSDDIVIFCVEYWPLMSYRQVSSEEKCHSNLMFQRRRSSLWRWSIYIFVNINENMPLTLYLHVVVNENYYFSSVPFGCRSGHLLCDLGNWIVIVLMMKNETKIHKMWSKYAHSSRHKQTNIYCELYCVPRIPFYIMLIMPSCKSFTKRCLF